MGKNYNGVQFSTTPTIVEEAGAAIADARNLILTYDENGKAVIAADGTAPLLGVALVEAGANDVTGQESGAVTAGDDIDILVHGICYVIASEAIAKGALVTADGGKAATASSGDHTIGIALSAATAAGDYVKVLVSRV